MTTTSCGDRGASEWLFPFHCSCLPWIENKTARIVLVATVTVVGNAPFIVVPEDEDEEAQERTRRRRRRERI